MGKGKGKERKKPKKRAGKAWENMEKVREKHGKRTGKKA